MRIQRTRARLAGILAITAVVALQAVLGFGCHGQDLHAFAVGFGVFVLPPLVPALVALGTANPLRAVGACALFAPWLLWAGYVGCIRPDAGGGASMAYVPVLLYGFPSAVLGALLAGPVCRRLGIAIDP